MNDVNTQVKKEIGKCNPWYVSSQFEWADSEKVKRIYIRRVKFIKDCILGLKINKEKIRLLDAGCGDGYYLSKLKNLKSVEFVGADYNPLRIERAKQSNPDTHILRMDLINLDFNNLGKFDVILFSQVIEHILDDEKVLQNLYELLNPYGILILGTTNEGSFLHRVYRSYKYFNRPFSTDHVHFYTEKEIIKKIQNTGFKITKIYREVFALPSNRLYYRLTSSDWGFKILEILTKIFPSECSDFYFKCQKIYQKGED